MVVDAVLDRFFAASPLALACLDMQGRLIRCNAALEHLLGCDEAELAGIRLVTAFTDEKGAAEAALFLELADRKRDAYSLEKTFVTKTGEHRIGKVHVTAIRDAGPNPDFCLAIIEDVTHLRAVEAKKSLNAKMEAVARLAREVVHRLNHLIVSTLGSCQLLLEGMPATDPARDVVESLRNVVGEAAQLTRRLGEFCGRQVLNPTEIELNALVNRVLSRVQQRFDNSIQVVARLQPDLGRVRVDPHQMERVLLELLDNAAEAMAGQGIIEIETCADEMPEEGRRLFLRIIDHGRGMDEKTRQRLFEPFYSTREGDRDRGMGLASVYGIVRQNGGQIDVQSELGHGTITTLSFSPAAENVPDLELPTASIGETLRCPQTVLLTDDDDQSRNSLARMLRGIGCEVLEARYGGEALLMCLRHDGPIHLLITDAVLQHTSGRELANQVRKFRPDIHVLYLGSEGPDLPSTAHERVLGKPFTPAQLIRTVRELFAVHRTDEVSEQRSPLEPATPNAEER